MKESRKEFIKDLHQSVCNELKQKIENEFPKLFKNTKKEANKWYKSSYGSSYLIFAEEIVYGDVIKGYGFDDHGNWFDSPNDCGITSTVLATDKEVEQALIKEAKKRGIKEGVKVRFSAGCERFLKSNDYYARRDDEELFLCVRDGGLGGDVIFTKGQWAEIITKITRKEAEKKLGLKIID